MGISKSHIVRRPELLHPFASAIDSPELEEPEELVSVINNLIMVTHKEDSKVIVKTNSKPNYVRLPEGPKRSYKNYGPDSIEGWHKKHGKFVE